MHYLRAEERLVKFCMEDWQRRGMHLLQVGLHSSVMPEFFWDCGFDVTCCEENFRAVQKAGERTGPRISYQIGKPDYLPFDDDSFDYAFLSLYADTGYVRDFGLPSFLLKGKKQTGKNMYEPYLAELCRVARLGVVVVGKNAFSFCRAKHAGAVHNPCSLWLACRKFCPKGRVRFASTGFMPRFMGKNLHFLNNAVSVAPFGALIGCSLQFNAPPMTGIGAFIKQEKRNLKEVSVIQRNIER